MNLSDSEIENLLRNPPRHSPPPGLKEKLIADIRMQTMEAPAEFRTSTVAPVGWLKRWWPIFAPAGISLACAATLVVQQQRIQELEAQKQSPGQGTPTAVLAAAGDRSGTADAAASVGDYQQEISRLKEQVSQLTSEVAELRRIKAHNGQLRAQLAAPVQLGLSPQEAEALAKATERAQSIQCVNNLKQFGLAVRVWALDNNDMTPPDVMSMSNELSSVKILICPADKGHTEAANWASCSPANCSYDFLAPADKEADSEPERVLSRCPIHGNVGLCDGSVQMGIGRTHPEWFVERNGKLYFEREPKAPVKQP